MSQTEYKVSRWRRKKPPTESEIHTIIEKEGLAAYRWSNSPGDVYGAHTHPFHKVIYVVQGSIDFGLPGMGEQAHLEAGDRLDLPPGVVHDAVVGSQGVVCLEAHISKGG
jgi:quercetin dioxygenase-like cupin family protein